VGAFARQIAGADPANAAQWAATIGNEDSRNGQVESILRNWINTDSSKAIAWITSSSLSNEMKAKLMPSR
jgi:hypothetical protein